MITRYSVVFAAQSVEPDHRGEWVKFEDYARDLNALEVSTQVQSEKASERDKARTEAAVEELRNGYEATIERQTRIIKAAHKRLTLHAHAPNCTSRYEVMSVDGNLRAGNCDCGLENWFKESEVYG